MADTLRLANGLPTETHSDENIAWSKDSDDAAASDATAERAFYRARGGETVASVHYTADAAITGTDTNNFAITVGRRTGGGARSAIVTYTNDVASGGVSAWVPKSLGTPANTALVADDILTVEITKNGTGQIVRKGTVVVGITRP